MKKNIYYTLIAVVFVLIGWFANTAWHLPKSVSNPISQVKPRPLEKYTIENLAKAQVKPVKITLGKVLTEKPSFTSYEFSFSFDPTLSGGPEKKVTGLINIPKGGGPFPLIVMFRGYVDQKQYVIGMGTQHAGDVFSQNGYITIAPDFLGYGNSDSESGNIFESRFQTYTTAMTLLKSLNHSIEQPFNYSAIGIWAHSNGGQITLTTLEATGLNIPTVLWAPVSKPFPYSILVYTDESSDHGKLIRSELSKFEEDYDVEAFSLTNYLDQIKAPIQLNQGTNDDAVPFYWSDALSKVLKEKDVEISYIKYPGNDHNMSPNWNQVVANNLTFYQKRVK